MLKNFGLELGIFCLCSGVVSILILARVKGDLSRLEGIFATKDWLFIKKAKNVGTYAKLFRYMATFIVLWPLFSLIAWATSVLYLAGNYTNPVASDYIPGVAILLVGLTIVLYAIPILQLKWNNFSISILSVILLILGTISFWAFQLCTLLMTSGNKS